MSNITDEQLQSLTSLINKRRAEWERGLSRLTLGEVRSIYDAYGEWQAEQDAERQMQEAEIELHASYSKADGDWCDLVGEEPTPDLMEEL